MERVRKYLTAVVQSVDNRTLRIGRSREERAWVGADPLHSAVYSALQDDRFKWRTVRGVAKQLGVAPE